MRAHAIATITRHLASLRAAGALAVLAPVFALAALPGTARAEFSVGLDIRIGYAPPPIPDYDQPPLPGPDYLWVPGYWAWSDWIDDYYWVDGYWDLPPEQGLLWTPAWWGWDRGAFRFHDGYWAHEVGWYGGIDYGHGYHGHGWEGGYWDHGHVAYNRSVVNVTNVNVTNVYYRPVTVINNGPRASYNGGNGGVMERPRPEEIRVMQAPHIAPTPVQQQHLQQAATNPHNTAGQLAPAWHPPAVHRVSADGAPIPRAAALATGVAVAGAPPAYQRPANGQMPGRGPVQPGMGQPGMGQPGMGQPGMGQPGRGPQGQGQYPGQPMGRASGAPPMGAPAAQGAYQPPRPAPQGQPQGQPSYGNQPRAYPQGQIQGQIQGQNQVQNLGQSGSGYGQAPRQTPPQGYSPPPRPVNPGYAPPPHPAPQAMPAPNAYHAPAPQAQPRPAPPPPPRPQPRPAPPADREHRDHN